MREMVFDQRHHLIDNRALDADAFEERAGHGAAGGFVTPGSPAHAAFALAEFGGGGLGEIVGERGEQEHGAVVGSERIAFGNARGLIQNVHGVDADVAFGMPFGVLRDAEEILRFRGSGRSSRWLADIRRCGRGVRF